MDQMMALGLVINQSSRDIIHHRVRKECKKLIMSIYSFPQIQRVHLSSLTGGEENYEF